MGGDEDIPSGCVALLCMQSIDVLCHAALRARSTGAFVASCSDSIQLATMLDEYEGKWVTLRMDGMTVVCGEGAPEVRGSSRRERSRAEDAVAGPAEVDLTEPRCAPLSLCSLAFRKLKS
jgi:hypothetical protein